MKKTLLGICGLGLALSLVACGDDVNFKDPVSVQKFLAKSDPQGVRKALEKQRDGKGFTLVEVLVPCPTNWGLTPVKAMERIKNELMTRYEMGEFIDR